MQVYFYRKIKILSEKWDSNLEKFLNEFSSKKVLIILFGSRSRKNHNLLSDYDIVIISEEEITEPVLDLPSDLFIFTINEAIQLLRKDNFIVKNALLNGQILINNIEKTNELFIIANE